MKWWKLTFGRVRRDCDESTQCGRVLGASYNIGIRAFCQILQVYCLRTGLWGFSHVVRSPFARDS